MKRIYFLSIIFIFILCSCGQMPTTDEVEPPEDMIASEPVQEELAPAEQEPLANKWKESYDLGVQFFSENQFDNAISKFEEAIEIDPLGIDAYISLAEAYSETEEYDVAISILQQATEIGEKTEQIEVLISSIELKKFPYERCLEEADHAMALRDADTALEWLKKAELHSNGSTDVKSRQEIIRLFDETYWAISLGTTVGQQYYALFHIDGTYSSITVNLSEMNGVFAYKDSTLYLDGTAYSKSEDSFISNEKYPMMGYETEGNYYTIDQDFSKQYDEIINSEEYLTILYREEARKKISYYVVELLDVASKTLDRTVEEIEPELGPAEFMASEGGITAYTFEKTQGYWFEAYDSDEITCSMYTYFGDTLRLDKQSHDDLLSALAYFLRDDYSSLCYRVPLGTYGSNSGADLQYVLCIDNLTAAGDFNDESFVTIFTNEE